jgi:hypothetical protein
MMVPGTAFEVQAQEALDRAVQNYDQMLADTDSFNNGVKHGIMHAVFVIRAALTGLDIGDTATSMAFQELEKLRRDIIKAHAV